MAIFICMYTLLGISSEGRVVIAPWQFQKSILGMFPAYRRGYHDIKQQRLPDYLSIPQ
jgi:hypothetical protein